MKMMIKEGSETVKFEEMQRIKLGTAQRSNGIVKYTFERDVDVKWSEPFARKDR